MWTGQIGRRAVAETFDVSTGHVTQDFQRYRQLAPRNLAYDVGKKCFHPTDVFKPVFEISEPEDVLRTIAATVSLPSQDRGRLLGFDIPADIAGPLPASMDPDLLKSLCRAIMADGLLDITYQSMNTPEPVSRQFAPRALIQTGQRWLVRGWDERHRHFRDLALARILRADVAGPADQLPRDDWWHEYVFIALGLADGLSKGQAEVTAREFGMKKVKGQYRVRIEARKAMVPYALDNLRPVSNSELSSQLPLRLLNYEAIKPFDRPNAVRVPLGSP